MCCRSYYTILNIEICLETPLQEINDYCDYMWKAFFRNHPTAKAELIQVVRSTNKENYFSIYNNGSIAIDWGRSLSEVPYRVLTKALENVVNGYAINKIDKKDKMTLHAGAVSKNQKAILILGESGNGKSTFTLELVANHGWRYLTDEVGLVDADHIVHPFLKTVSFTPGLVNLSDTWTSKHFGIDHQLSIPAVKHGTPAPLKTIIFIKYSPEKELLLAPIKKSDSLVRLFRSQIGRAKSVASVKQIADVVKNVHSYQLYHKNAFEAARLVTALVEADRM
jgi:hypothetical protein